MNKNINAIVYIISVIIETSCIFQLICQIHMKIIFVIGMYNNLIKEQKKKYYRFCLLIFYTRID